MLLYHTCSCVIMNNSYVVIPHMFWCLQEPEVHYVFVHELKVHGRDDRKVDEHEERRHVGLEQRPAAFPEHRSTSAN